jgi:hypothetical protein
MKEYIEREALLENLSKFAPEHNTPLIQLLVTRQPTADVVEVVRCKDCGRGGKIYGKAILCTEHKRITRPTDFCSYGVRKDTSNEI